MPQSALRSRGAGAAHSESGPACGSGLKLGNLGVDPLALTLSEHLQQTLQKLALCTAPVIELGVHEHGF